MAIPAEASISGTTSLVTGALWIVAAFLFLQGLKRLQRPDTARRGNLLSATGMLIAAAAALWGQGTLDLPMIGVGLGAGALIGAVAARRVAMTAMPELVALFNGSGGLASLLITAEAHHRQPDMLPLTAAAASLSLLIGGLTFTGSLVAWGKLSERIGSRPFQFQAQQILNGGLALALLGLAGAFVAGPDASPWLAVCLIAGAFVLGVLVVLPIGGADMPVVIALLNSYSGMAACATGFVLSNSILIVTGALVGASGLILTRIMCRAMNRSLTNVLFGGFGAVNTGTSTDTRGDVKPVSAEDAYVMLEAAHRIAIVPGYGLAVAQAQHVLRDLANQLETNGAEVQYAIHPVAGRMPGHMNVLLAEASVPYDHLVDMDTINPAMNQIDVCLIIGANDVVNPAAHQDPQSPIFGMPIIRAEDARVVIVLKRSMRPGFAGIENLLFYRANTRMLFGDAKASLQELVAQFKAS